MFQLLIPESYVILRLAKTEPICELVILSNSLRQFSFLR